MPTNNADSRSPSPAMFTAFVHLAQSFDSSRWYQKWKNGELIGINEPLPYGYHRAAEFGAQVDYSKSAKESLPLKFLRLALRVILGFDYIHAWRNRAAIQSADVVWTHTESQSLAVLAVLNGVGGKSRPKTIMESVWLIDRWHKLSPLHKWLYKLLLVQADVLTFHSEDNLSVARSLFPKTRCELVLFGINADEKVSPEVGTFSRPTRVLSVGNDTDRDWPCLIDALKSRADVTVRIVSQTIRSTLVQGIDNVKIVAPKSNAELTENYAWAEVVVVPLKRNLHASGITALQEAALRGIPAVASNTGGLKSYFGDDAVTYVAPDDASALRAGVLDVINAPGLALQKALAAQSAMGPTGLSSTAFAKKHVDLSIELLGQNR